MCELFFAQTHKGFRAGLSSDAIVCCFFFA